MQKRRKLLLSLGIAAIAALTAISDLASPARAAGPVADQDAEVERVATDFRFTEGPVALGESLVLFTDIPNNEILAYDVNEEDVSVWREASGGANGLWWVAEDDQLYVCEGGRRQMVRYGLDSEGDPTSKRILASRYKGKRLNSPNDLTVDEQGGVYFTDPRYGDRSSMEMDIEGVYYISPGGELSRVIDELEKPNGLILSQDEQTLYVVDNGAENVWAYDVTGPGKLSNGRVFSDMSEGPRAGGGDGMTLDEQGNVYVAGSKDVWVWNDGGELLRRIAVPEGPSNCTFGGPGRDTLYITARSSLYRIPMNVAGAR